MFPSPGLLTLDSVEHCAAAPTLTPSTMPCVACACCRMGFTFGGYTGLWHLLTMIRPRVFPDPCARPAQTPRVTFPLLVYSHRGGALEQPTAAAAATVVVENSIQAFANSAALGVDVLEMDVQVLE